MGHHKIAYMSNLDAASTVTERLAGYRRALAHAGIAYRDALVQRDPGDGDSGIGCDESVIALLKLPDPPTAICAVNDVVALRVIEALSAQGLEVPADMSVVGFDGIERWAPTMPFLTTVQQPFERIGEQAVELLLERIENGPDAPYKHVVLDVEFAVHRSTRSIATASATICRQHRQHS